MKQLLSVQSLLKYIMIFGGIGLSLTSCKDDDLKNDWNQETDEPSLIKADINYTYEKPSYIGNVSGKMREALGVCVPNQKGSIDASTKLVLLGSLNEIPYETLESAYKAGATIAVENPKTSDFETFFTSHPEWAGYQLGTKIDDKLIYSFDNDGSSYMIEPYHPIDFESIPYVSDEGEDEEANNDFAGLNGENVIPETEYLPEYYTYISSWLNYLNNDDDLDSGSSSDPNQEANAKFLEFASSISVAGEVKFDIDPRFRKYNSKNYWEIPKDPKTQQNPTTTVSYSLSIYPVHVYDGENSSGNYFMVTAKTTVGNNAWRTDSKRNTALCQIIHGTHCHYAGYYLKDATIHFQLVDKNGRPVATVPGSAPVLPDNVIAETQYSSTREFTLEGSTSVSAGKSTGKKDSKTSIGGEASLTAGWKWSHSVSFNQKDVNIVQNGLNLSNGTVGWILNYFNTPCFDMGKYRWIDISKNPNAQNSQSFDSGWVWYDKNGKDESEQKYYVRIYISGHCEAASFKTGTGDWRTKTQPFMYSDKNKITEGIDFINDQVITVETRLAGTLVLENKNKDKYISHVKLWNDTTPSDYLYYSSESIDPGKALTLGSYYTRNKTDKNKKNKFRLTYEVNNGDGSYDIYEYRDHRERTFELTEKGTRTLKTDADFVKIGTYTD
ncbi:MAG: hypothetical protein HDR84_01265 [Bacteroides sp.]|nr:hypothetical protein [Bacteroides sp.]